MKREEQWLQEWNSIDWTWNSLDSSEIASQAKWRPHVETRSHDTFGITVSDQRVLQQHLGAYWRRESCNREGALTDQAMCLIGHLRKVDDNRYQHIAFIAEADRTPEENRILESIVSEMLKMGGANLSGARIGSAVTSINNFSKGSSRDTPHVLANLTELGELHETSDVRFGSLNRSYLSGGGNVRMSSGGRIFDVVSCSNLTLRIENAEASLENIYVYGNLSISTARPLTITESNIDGCVNWNSGNSLTIRSCVFTGMLSHEGGVMDGGVNIGGVSPCHT